MHYTKLPLTYPDQVQLLINRGLAVPDQARAMRWLQRISYYRLSAYFLPFKIRGTNQFRPGTSFHDVIHIYKLDCRLRVLILQAIERIEVAFRTSLTYEMSHSLGVFAYSDPRHFSRHFNHLKMMQGIADDERRSKEDFVTHYRTNYPAERFLPIWMVTELVSLGSLSRMYSGLTRHTQRQISNVYGIPEGSMKSWMHTLNYIRNACAHHNRLWNRKLAIRPLFPPKWTYTVPSQDRIYAVLLVIQYLLGVIAPHCRWKDRMISLLLAEPALHLQWMGFPQNWIGLDPWSHSAI